MAASPCTGASLDLVQLLQLAFQVSTILTVFGFGLAASVEDVLYLVRHPRMLLISLVSMFIVMPFVALGLAWVFDPPQVARVALVWPWRFPRFPRSSRPKYSAPQGVVLPLAAGMLVRAFLPRLAHRVEEPATRVAKVVLAAATVLLLVAAFPQLLAAHTISTVAAIAAFTVLGLAFGHVLAGPNPGDSAVLALSSALRHPGIALAIAAGNFPSLDFGAVVILYLLTAAIVCAPYTKRMYKRQLARQEAA
jgi:BASS family bile acid:Na+ symporter